MGARLVNIKANPENGEQVRPIIEQTGKGDLLCYENSSGRWFRSSQDFVNDVIKMMNDRSEKNEENLICLNDLLDSLGLYSISKYYEYGWRLNRLPFASKFLKTRMFENGFQGMNEPVFVITSIIPVMKDYYKEEI